MKIQDKDTPSSVDTSTTDDDTQNSKTMTTRRKLIRSAGIGGTVLAVGQWHSPIVKSIFLPAHAATSPTGPVGSSSSSGGGSTSSTSSSGAGGSSGGAGSSLTVSAAADAASGVSGSVSGAAAGEDVDFHVMFFGSDSQPKPGSFTITIPADGSGDATFSLTPAELLATYGAALDPGCTVVIQVETESGDTANDSAQIPNAPPASFSVKDSGPLPDGGVSLSGCGATPGTQVTFTVTVKDNGGTPLATGRIIPVLVENDGCATFDYTYADLNADIGGDPPNGYYVCIDGEDSTGAQDSTDVYAPDQ